jgi:hypothetical protein
MVWRCLRKTGYVRPSQSPIAPRREPRAGSPRKRGTFVRIREIVAQAIVLQLLDRVGGRGGLSQPQRGKLQQSCPAIFHSLLAF